MLGRKEDAQDLQVLTNLGITHILNITNVVPNYFPDKFIYYQIPIEGNLIIKNNIGCNYVDNENIQIIDEFPAAASYIRHVELLKGRVLVHCIAGLLFKCSCIHCIGVSRSVTIVLMYLVAIHRMKLKDCYDFVEKLRLVLVFEFNI